MRLDSVDIRSYDTLPFEQVSFGKLEEDDPGKRTMIPFSRYLVFLLAADTGKPTS